MFQLSTNNIEKNKASNSSWLTSLSILLISASLTAPSTLAQEESASDRNQEEQIQEVVLRLVFWAYFALREAPPIKLGCH